MPRARNSFVHGVVGASIVLSMAAVDVGPALAADTGNGVPATDTSVRYQVRKGDSLSAIARRNGVTVGALTAANHLTNPHLIVVGQWLVIPRALAPGAEPASAPVARATLVPTAAPADAPAESPLVYVLHGGDSLSAVARRFKVTVAALVAANGIRNPNRVPVGLKLTIPGQAAPAAPTGRARGRPGRAHDDRRPTRRRRDTRPFSHRRRSDGTLDRRDLDHRDSASRRDRGSSDAHG